MNVILLITDTMRADYLGCYGNEWTQTPHINRLAEQSAVFTRAYAEGCPTLQARRALWTGRRTFPFADDVVKPGDRLNVQYGWQPLHDSDWCLSEMVRECGYWNGFITDTPHYFKPSMNFHRGFDTWEFIRGQEAEPYRSGFMYDGERGQVDSFEARQAQAKVGLRRRANVSDRQREEDYHVAQVFRRATRWLEDNFGVEGFFLVVDAFDPHEPWDPPRHYEALYGDEDLWSTPIVMEGGNLEGASEEQVLAARRSYAGEVTLYDRWLGHFLATAELMGLLENTLIVLVADHGSNHGEHGWMHKGGYAMYDSVVRIPLIIRHPGGEGATERIDGLAYNMDIVPTILEYCGVPVPERVQGRSLWPLIEGREDELRSCVTSGYNEWLWYRDAEWVYTGDLAGRTHRLFAIRDDPGETTNLADQRPEVVERLRQAIVDEAGPLREDEGTVWPPPPDCHKRHWQVW